MVTLLLKTPPPKALEVRYRRCLQLEGERGRERMRAHVRHKASRAQMNPSAAAEKEKFDHWF